MYYILFAVIAYLLGSIPSALVVGKVGYNIDIRNYGSGNLGATNTFRVLGLKAGLIVTVSDILKGTVASLLPLIFQQTEIHILIIGLFAVLGHTYPIFARFKGESCRNFSRCCTCSKSYTIWSLNWIFLTCSVYIKICFSCINGNRFNHNDCLFIFR